MLKSKAIDGVAQKKKTQAQPKRKKSVESFHFRVFKKKKSLVFLKIALFVVAVILILAAAAFGYQNFYNNKIFKGVRVLNIDAGGHSPEELKALLKRDIENYKIIITSEDQKYEVTLNDLGIVYNTEGMVREAYLYGREGNLVNKLRERAVGFLSQYDFGFRSLAIEEKEIMPVYATSQIRLGDFLTDLENKINITAKDSEIKIANGQVEIIPAVFGKKLRTEILEQELIKAATYFEHRVLEVRTDEILPEIYDEGTKELADKTGRIAAKQIVLDHEGKKFYPMSQNIIEWISFFKKDNLNWELGIDQLKIKAYLAVLGREINVWPQDKIVRVENGVKETITQEGIEGLVIDEGSLAATLADKLADERINAIFLTIPMKVAPYSTKRDEVVVANWEKYIDLNLSTQTLVAYEKGGIEKGRWLVATGKPGYATPVGTWLVHGKSSWIRMAGGWGTSEYYNVYPVKWVTWFKGGGYAIHDAYWRSSFGYTGSHGCVNMPDDGAIFIYNWADIGTPVTVHY
ncbi:MAG: peptidoglycan binding domain-containing protein [Bacteriovoracaceae bacterium]